jgi:hypothetical protein
MGAESAAKTNLFAGISYKSVHNDTTSKQGRRLKIQSLR